LAGANLTGAFRRSPAPKPQVSFALEGSRPRIGRLCEHRMRPERMPWPVDRLKRRRRRRQVLDQQDSARRGLIGDQEMEISRSSGRYLAFVEREAVERLIGRVHLLESGRFHGSAAGGLAEGKTIAIGAGMFLGLAQLQPEVAPGLFADIPDELRHGEPRQML